MKREMKPIVWRSNPNATESLYFDKNTSIKLDWDKVVSEKGI